MEQRGGNMKKLLIILFLSVFSLGLTSCDLFQQTTSLNITSSTTEAITALNSLTTEEITTQSKTTEGTTTEEITTQPTTQETTTEQTKTTQPTSATTPATFDLTILSVNDLHGYIQQDDYGYGGISNMAYLIDQIRDQSPLDDVVLIANGDMFQGTAISNMTEGRAVIEVMNMMDFDVMGIGNHEFDWGIDTILQYFDGNPDNGEADFPLLNANIYLNSDNSLLAVSGGNVFQYSIVERECVEVGIISYIGDIYNSIAYNQVQDYHFDLDIAGSVASIATALKESGVDVIVVNIHGGSGGGIESYIYNEQLAELKDSHGNYLVDVVINGHTHSYQTGTITRTNGTPLIGIQAGSYGNAFGEIVLTIDLADMSISDYSYQIVNTSSAGTNYDSDIETYIENTVASLGTTVLAESGETITSKSQFEPWTANVMIAATGADIGVSNHGGLRSDGNIIAGEDVTLAQLYEICPFDNTIWLIDMTYSEVMDFIANGSLYYEVADGVSLDDSQTYTVAVISYVYYWEQLDNVRSGNDIDTGLYLRDLLVKDIEAKDENGELFSPYSNPEASIGLQPFVVYTSTNQIIIPSKSTMDLTINN